MDLAIKCNKCGKWQHKITNNLSKAQFKCFRCGKAKQIKDFRGEYNMHLIRIPDNKQPYEIIQKLNERDNEE